MIQDEAEGSAAREHHCQSQVKNLNVFVLTLGLVIMFISGLKPINHFPQNLAMVLHAVTKLCTNWRYWGCSSVLQCIPGVKSPKNALIIYFLIF